MSRITFIIGFQTFMLDMTKFRYKNWLVLLTILLAYAIMGYYNGFFAGFLQGFLIAVSLAILIGELYYIFTGKEMRGYILGSRKTSDEYLP